MTSVDIYGRSYNIRTSNEPETIRALARYVDGRMRQIAEQADPGDVVAIAVLAALNIADDYYRTRRALDRREHDVSERTRSLTHELAQALEPVKQDLVRTIDE